MQLGLSRICQLVEKRPGIKTFNTCSEYAELLSPQEFNGQGKNCEFGGIVNSGAGLPECEQKK